MAEAVAGAGAEIMAAKVWAGNNFGSATVILQPTTISPEIFKSFVQIKTRFFIKNFTL